MNLPICSPQAPSRGFVRAADVFLGSQLQQRSQATIIIRNKEGHYKAASDFKAITAWAKINNLKGTIIKKFNIY